jgi:hypothetical protein
MKKLLYICLVALTGCILISCGSDEDKNSSEKGAIEKLSDETSAKIVNQLKSPIDAALRVQQKVNIETERRVKNLDEPN